MSVVQVQWVTTEANTFPVQSRSTLKSEPMTAAATTSARLPVVAVTMT